MSDPGALLILLAALAVIWIWGRPLLTRLWRPDTVRAGHRRPIPFGLWQPGPREREEVKARFLANIRRYGPQWGQPAWDKYPFPRRGPASPHDYIVEVPWSSSRDKYVLLAQADRTQDDHGISIIVCRQVEGSAWRNPLVKKQPSYYPGRGVAMLYSLLRGTKLTFFSGEKEDPELQAAAAQIEDALRDALE